MTWDWPPTGPAKSPKMTAKPGAQRTPAGVKALCEGAENGWEDGQGNQC